MLIGGILSNPVVQGITINILSEVLVFVSKGLVKIGDDKRLCDIIQTAIDDLSNEIPIKKFQNGQTFWDNFACILNQDLKLENLSQSEIRRVFSKILKENLLEDNCNINVDEVYDMFFEKLIRVISNDQQLTNLIIIKYNSEVLTKINELKPKYNKLLEAVDYFNTYGLDLLINTIESDSLKNSIQSIYEYVISDKTILILHSPSGYGKTHLLREAIKEISKNSEYIIRFISPGLKGINDAVQIEIDTKSSYLLFLDMYESFNAEEINNLIAISAKFSQRVKLVLALNRSSVKELKKVVRKYKLTNYIMELGLNDWKTEDLIKLFDVSFPNNDLDEIEKELIVTVYKIPSFVVLSGKNIAKRKFNENIDIENIKEEYVNEIETEAEKAVGEILDSNLIQAFFRDISLVMPFRLDSQEELSNLSTRLNISNETLTEVVNSLIDIGLFRLFGNVIRFNPDIKGDLYVAYNIKKIAIHNSIEYWASIDLENLLTNLVSASRYSDDEVFKKFFFKLVNQWIDEIESNYFENKNRLKLITQFCHIVPDETMNLVSIYLEDLSNEIKAGMDSKLFSLKSDDFSPVLLRLWRFPHLRNDILKCMEDIITLSIIGYYDNYKPKRVIKDFVSPFQNSLEAISKTLDVFESWFSEGLSSARVEITIYALTALLQLSYEETITGVNKIGFHNYSIKLNDEFNIVRDKAIELLVKFFESGNEKLILDGIEIVESVGNAGFAGVSRDDKETFERITQERTKLISKLIQVYYDKQTNYKIVNSIENLFIKLWASKSIPDETIEPFLIEMDRSVEYLFIRRFVSPDYFISDFHELIKSKVNDDRWKWYVHNIMCERWENDSNCVKEIASRLNFKYQSIEDIIRFLVESDANLSEYSGIWAKPKILTFWVGNNIKLFQDAYKDKMLWSKIPNRFSSEIELTILKGNDDEFNELVEKILSKDCDLSRDLAEAFLLLSSEKDMDSGVLENCLNVIAEMDDLYFVNLLLLNLRNIFRKHKVPNIHLNILLKIAIKMDIENDHMLTYMSFNIKEINEIINITEDEIFARIRIVLKDKIKKISELSYNADIIIGQVCENITEVCEIITYRINCKTDKVCPDNFEVVPYESLKSVDDKINSYDDFKIFFSKLKGCCTDIDEVWTDEIKTLIRHISYKIDGITNEKYLSIYIRELLLSNEILEAVYCSHHLPSTIDSVDILTMVLEEARKQNFIKEIEKLLFRLRRKNSLSWTTGETPQELLVLKDFFAELNKRQVAVRIRIVIGKMLQSVDLEIESIRKGDEERLNPRL